MDKTVVIGGAGFLGSHLVDQLLRETADEVICVDNLSKGSRNNFAQNLKNPRFKFCEVDILNLQELRKACGSAKRIANLAAGKIPRYGGRLDTLRTNSIGMMNILEVAKETGARVLLASTSDVYGKNPELPFSEEGNSVLGSSTSARWAYAVSKLFDEQLMYAYHEEYKVPVSIVRIFGSYGPRQHLSWWGGPQAVFISAMLKGETIELHGDGQQTRSFCFVQDTVGGLFAAFTREKALGEIINIGNTQEISIMNLAKTIHRLLKLPGEMKSKLIPLSQFSRNYEDVRARVPDISKAKKFLDWSPQIDLEDGLHQTIAWQRTQIKP